MGAMTPPSRKSCYNFRVVEINRVVDGDTIDVTIDLGFDLYKKERVRVAESIRQKNEHAISKRKHLVMMQPIGSKTRSMVLSLAMMISLLGLSLMGVLVNTVDSWDGFTSETKKSHLTNK